MSATPTEEFDPHQVLEIIKNFEFLGDRDNINSYKWSGIIRVKQTCKIKIKTTSDDSSRVYIYPYDVNIYTIINHEDYLICDNSGTHSVRELESKLVDLTEGDNNNILILYGNAGGPNQMEFKYSIHDDQGDVYANYSDVSSLISNDYIRFEYNVNN